MATRLERLQESLKREEHRADQKRLEKARNYLRLGLETLNHSFHNQEFETYADTIKPQIAEFTQQLGNIAEI